MSTDNWADDKLQRKKSAQFLTKYLIGRQAHQKSSFVLNINATWGLGKSFFLERWSKDLKDLNHPVIFFNAWENDFSSEPLAAFLSEIEDELKPLLKNNSKAKNKLKAMMKGSASLLKSIAPQILPVLTKKITGETIEDWKVAQELVVTAEEASAVVSGIVSVATEQLLKDTKIIKKSIVVFRENLSKLIADIDSDNELPLFIFVDELDRCRPDFSIRFLEIVKHLFGVHNVCFVIATDTTQLSASIKALYGESFDSYRYLHRFFDQEFSLPEPNYLDYASFLFSNYNIPLEKLYCPLDENIYHQPEQAIELFSLFAKYFKLSLREQERVFNLIDAIVLTYQGKILYFPWLLFLTMLHVRSPGLFNSFRGSSRDVNKLLTDSHLVGVDNTVRFKAYNRDGNSFSQAEFGLTTLIHGIDPYFNQDLSVIKGNNNHIVQSYGQNIMNYFRQLEMPAQWQASSPPQHDLPSYSELVSQAGYLDSVL